MKKLIIIALASAMIIQMGIGNATVNAADVKDNEQSVPMYRLYNSNSGEHFYTANQKEKNYLAHIGWKYEGIGWNAPSEGNPVYRLYNKNGGEHHYTMKESEKDALVSLGWKDEGIGWYSDVNHTVPLYRQYNPNAFANNHNYTTSKGENDYLAKLGWKPEGIGWYGIKNKNEEKPARRLSLIKVESNQNHPSDYYVDNTPDKIGYFLDEPDYDGQSVYISLNGNLKQFDLKDSDDDEDSDLYATDINDSDGYKNLILIIHGPDDVCHFYIFAYRDKDILLLGHTEQYDESAIDYLISGAAITGNGKLYLMGSERFSADPDGQLGLRTSVYVNGKNFISNEEKKEIYHRNSLKESFMPGCRFLLSEDTAYIDNENKEEGIFKKGTLLNVIATRSDDENYNVEYLVESNGVKGWVTLDSDNLANWRGFA